MLIARLIKSNTVLYRKIREGLAFLDSAFLLRPPLLFPVWILIAAGMAASSSQRIPELYWVKSIHVVTVVFFAGLTLIAGGALLQYQEKSREAKILASRLMAGGLTLAAGVSVYLLVAEGKSAPSLATGWIMLTAFIWLVFHAGNPFHRSPSTVKGMVIYGLIGLGLFMAGWTYGSGRVITGLVYAVPYVLVFAAISTLAADAHRRGVTVALTTLLVATAVVSGILLEDPVIGTGSALTLPFFLVALAFSRMDHVIRAIRYPILIMGIFVSVRYPWLFVSLFALYYVSKVYYYFRFDIDYPTFHVEGDG